MRSRAALACCVLACWSCGVRERGDMGPPAKSRDLPAPPRASTEPANLATRQSVAAAGAATASPLPAARPWFRVVRASDPTFATIGPRVEGLGQWVVTGTAEQGELEIDVDQGARVRLGPQTQLFASERVPGSLLLLRGRVSVELLPDAGRVGRATLRLVTAHGSLLVPTTAELLIGAHAADARRAGVQVCLLRGAVEWLRVGASGLQREVLLSGQASYPRTAPLQVTSAPNVREALRVLSEARAKPRDQPALLDADRNLERAAGKAAELRVQGDRLLAAISPQHARALGDAAASVQRPRDEAQIRSYQRELATHAQRKHDQAQLLLLAAEQSLLARLLACPSSTPSVASAAPCPALQDWQQRFSAELASAR